MNAGGASLANKGSVAIQDGDRYGLKAVGLASLPRDWTPPFFALSVGAAAQLSHSQSMHPRLDAALASLGPAGEGLIVRSSAQDEAIASRGAFDSSRCGTTVADVAAAIDAIATRAGDAADELGFVVHPWLSGLATGHLSNERRVSRDRRSWLWEAELELPTSSDNRFRVDSAVADSPDLQCPSLNELPSALRAIARWATSAKPRSHFEWVWDGERVWVVQRDVEMAISGPRPGSAWQYRPASPITTPLRLFKTAATAEDVFPKAKHVGVFTKAGLPHGDVHVLSGSRTMSRLADDKISRALEHDLRTLIEAPVVVRTDFRASTDDPVLMSRRTDTCTTYEQLASFLVETARDFIETGNSPGSFAFLVHRFLLAEAGAFAFAEPGKNQVMVDATWGIPDSLLFHPHDSYRVDVERGDVEPYLRCKTDYIDVDEAGEWRSRPAGTPWDWRRSLSDETALVVADISAKIAAHVGTAVEVMFFIGLSETGRWVLPWFYNQSHKPIADVHASRGYYVGERVQIKDDAGLDAVDERLRLKPATRLTLTLRPTIDLLRSRDFVQKVAQVATRWSLPVELEGSHLSHAYYLLENAGAHVRSVNPWRPPERRQPFGKLVRDLVPVRIERHGEYALTYSAERDELDGLIRAKLIEEALEYFWADDRASSIEELADLLELLRAAAKVLGVSYSTIERTAASKRKERGGFESGVVLVETRDALAAQRDSTLREPGQSLLPHDTSRQRRRTLANRRVVRLPGRRLLVPAAPAAGFRRDMPRTVALDADEDAVITYGSTSIQVQIRPRQASPGRDQLTLDVDRESVD